MTQRPDDRLAVGGAADQRVANHERTVEALNRAHARLRDELIPRVSGLASIPHPVLVPWRHVIAEKVSQAQRHLADLDGLLRLVLPSWSLPQRLWRTAAEWVPVRTTISSVAGDLGVTNREIHVRWQGVAADTYGAVVPAHAGAASRLATVADAVQFALNWAGSAIAQMYAAVLGLVVGFIGAGLIALATAATVVGAVAAIVALLVVAGTVLTVMSSVIVAAAQGVGTARTWLTEMASEMGDNTAFPGGQWPAARSEWFTDATTTDGDPSDWAVR